MIKSSHCLLVFCALLIETHTLRAQGFEGVIHERNLNVPPAALAKLVGSAENPDTAKLFKIPLDSLFAIALPPGLPDGEIRSTGMTTTYIKGKRFRSEHEAQPTAMTDGYLVVDKEADSMVMLNPMTHQAMFMSFDAMHRMGGAMMGVMGNAAANAAQGDTTTHIRKLPKTRELGKRTLIGFPTTGYETILDDGRTVEWDSMELLAAKQAMAFDMEGMMREMGMPASSQLHKEVEHGMTLVSQRLSRIPAMLARLMGSGYSFQVNQVLSVERRPVPDSMFAIPHGYSKVDMGAIWPGPKRPPVTTP